MRIFLKPLIALAALGLAASAVVHVCALLSVPNPFGPYAWALHAGIFVIWLPAVIVSNAAMKDVSFKRKDFWTVALSGCPPWMRRMVKGLFVYALLNFGLFMARTIGLKHDAIDRSVELRGFSGHWMVFYAAGMALLYSSSRAVAFKCANGHAASPLAKFCEQCGAPVSPAA